MHDIVSRNFLSCMLECASFGMHGCRVWFQLPHLSALYSSIPACFHSLTWLAVYHSFEASGHEMEWIFTLGQISVLLPKNYFKVLRVRHTILHPHALNGSRLEQGDLDR
jgi:hypothetical protein